MKWTADQVLDVLEKKIDHLDNEMHRELEGFPEHYATQVEIDLLRNQIDGIRSDHVARRELDEVKKAAAEVANQLRIRLDEQAGRRAATTVAISVVATILAVMFGFAWNSQLTSADVSDQVNREAPWNKDKVSVEARIGRLEASAQAQRIQLSRIETQIRFFCATRTRAGLPGC